MNKPRADWTPPHHLRSLLRLLDDLIRQARTIRATAFAPELVALQQSGVSQALDALRDALDALHACADRVQDAAFNYRETCRLERKQKHH